VPDSCTQSGSFKVRQCNGIIHTGPQPTPVALVTKFYHVAGVCATAEGDHDAGL